MKIGKLVLENIKFNDYNLIIDEKNDILYYSLVNNNKTKYNPNISFVASDDKAKLVILGDKITDDKVKNNYKINVMIYNDNQYHIYNLSCTDFPILNINYDVSNMENKNIHADIYLFNNLSNSVNRVIKSRIKLDIIEKENLKKDYVFSLKMLTPSDNVRDNPVTFLDMKPSSRYTLEELENIEENQKDFRPNNRLVELFINNEYVGLYSLKVDKEEKRK